MTDTLLRPKANLDAYTLTVEEPGRVGFQAIEEAPLGADEVRIKTLYSGISAGTEMTAFMGSNPYLHKRWDAEQKLFVQGGQSMAYPMDAIGYEEVGEIVETGSDVNAVRKGQLVWGYWGHRSILRAKGRLGAGTGDA